MPHGRGRGSMITLFVGDNDQSLASQALAQDPTAFLVDHSNWKQIVRDKPVADLTIYTSLSDLPKIDKHTGALWDLVQIADRIFYCPPEKWSDDTGPFRWTSQQTLTEYYLHLARQNGKSVVGLDLERYKNSSYLELVDKRINDSKSLWISGCSVSHGVGVDVHQRYGDLIAKQMSIPAYHLTQSGASLEWAADQILRSDIRSGDIVIWGLTEETRAPVAKNGGIFPMDDGPANIDYRLDETRYYKAITSVHQVINHCDKIGCDLILLPLICSERLCMGLSDQKSFYHLPYQLKPLDYGLDNLHPGPRQHKFYADFCLNIIKRKHQ